MNSEAKDLSSNPRSAIFLLCDLGQVIFSMHHAQSMVLIIIPTAQCCYKD